MEPSFPLSYAPGLERRHPTMNMIWGHGGRLEKKREMLLNIISDFRMKYINKNILSKLCVIHLSITKYYLCLLYFLWGDDIMKLYSVRKFPYMVLLLFCGDFLLFYILGS